MMCMKMLSAQISGPARITIATTITHVGHFCLVSVDKRVLSGSAGRVMDSGSRQQMAIVWIAVTISLDSAHRQGVHDKFALATFVTPRGRT
jgi:hypothetical protein